MLGKKHSKETKQKMSEVRKGKNCYWYGKHLSNETKQKLSDKKKKKVNQYTIDGKFIKTWPSLQEIERQTGIFATLVCQACRREGSSHGFKWKYHNTSNDYC